MSVGLPRLLAAIRDGTSNERGSALKRLRDGGKQAYDEPARRLLADVVRSDRSGVNRLTALDLLVRSWPEADVERVLVEAFEAEHFIAERAVALLGCKADARAFDVLEVAFLGARNVWVKINVLRVFHRAPQARILQFLQRTNVLACAEDNLRATAVSMLANVRNPSLRSVFLGMVHDRNDRVRANAVEGLGACLTGKGLVRALAPLVTDRNNRVRANALLLLLRLGIERAEAALRQMVDSTSALFRASAAYVIGEAPFAPSRRDMLTRLLSDGDAMVVRQAERALQKQLVVA